MRYSSEKITYAYVRKVGVKKMFVTARLIYDPLAVPLTYLFAKTGFITANMVTLGSFIWALIPICLFSTGYMISGAIATFIFHVLDCVDGKLARVTGKLNPMGAFYDFLVDRIVLSSMFIAMSITFLRNGMINEIKWGICYLLLFLLKDTLELKLNECKSKKIREYNYKEVNYIENFSDKFKIHFKPGQHFSVQIVYLFGPITGWYIPSFIAGIICVSLSIIANVLLPNVSEIKRRYK